MANRTFNQNQQLTLVKRVVQLWPNISFGASGAPTLQKRVYTAGGSTALASSSSLVAAPTTGIQYAIGDAAGTMKIAQTGTGAYTLTLSDPYQALLGLEVALISNTTGLTSVDAVALVSGSTTITTNTSVGSGGVIAFKTLNSTSGAAGNPTSGDVWTLCITLLDATEP